MNRTFWIVLGPTTVVAIGYVFVLRAMSMEPPYLKLAAIVTLLAAAFWWIGRKSKQSRESK